MEILADETRDRIARVANVTLLPKHVDGEEPLRARYPYLGAGEIAVLARAQQLAAERTPYTCVLDDKRARNVAQALKLELTGTLGLLARLEQRGAITGAERLALVAELRARGFRVPEGI